jgi:ElaB/YqjD/DUF883 family membrane-anchored ribosome-binding protein
MTDDQDSGFGSPGIGSVSSDHQGNSDQELDLGAKTGETVSKLAEAVQQVGSQAKETATSLASEAGEKAKGLLNHQVEAGADFVGEIAQSVRMAADSLNQNAPQLAGLVRGVAQQVDEFSETVRGQTVEGLFETTSDFVRRNPALVFSAAAACGFMLFRVIRASPSNGLRPEPYRENSRSAGRMQQAAGDGGDRFESQRSGGQSQASPFNGA